MLGEPCSQTLFLSSFFHLHIFFYVYVRLHTCTYVHRVRLVSEECETSYRALCAIMRIKGIEPGVLWKSSECFQPLSHLSNSLVSFPKKNIVWVSKNFVRDTFLCDVFIVRTSAYAHTCDCEIMDDTSLSYLHYHVCGSLTKFTWQVTVCSCVRSSNLHTVSVWEASK